MNMQNLMMQAKKMQKDIEKTQKELESKIYEGSSQIVTASVNGNGKLLSINIEIDDCNSAKITNFIYYKKLKLQIVTKSR